MNLQIFNRVKTNCQVAVIGVKNLRNSSHKVTRQTGRPGRPCWGVLTTWDCLHYPCGPCVAVQDLTVFMIHPLTQMTSRFIHSMFCLSLKYHISTPNFKWISKGLQSLVPIVFLCSFLTSPFALRQQTITLNPQIEFTCSCATTGMWHYI